MLQELFRGTDLIAGRLISTSTPSGGAIEDAEGVDPRDCVNRLILGVYNF